MSQINPYQQAFRGDEFRPTADQVNAWTQAARRGGQAPMGQAGSEDIEDGATILVKNGSGAIRKRFEVLGISNSVINPAANAAGFQRVTAAVGVTPAAEHADKFAVLAGPIAPGRFGQAYTSGQCRVRIDVTDAAHGYARAKAGDCTQLESAASGAAQILWKEEGTGTKWAIIRFGGGGGGVTAVESGVPVLGSCPAGGCCEKLAPYGAGFKVGAATGAGANAAFTMISPTQIGSFFDGTMPSATTIDLYDTAHPVVAEMVLAVFWRTVTNGVTAYKWRRDCVVHSVDANTHRITLETGTGVATDDALPGDNTVITVVLPGAGTIDPDMDTPQDVMYVDDPLKLNRLRKGDPIGPLERTFVFTRQNGAGRYIQTLKGIVVSPLPLRIKKGGAAPLVVTLRGRPAPGATIELTITTDDGAAGHIVVPVDPVAYDAETWETPIAVSIQAGAAAKASSVLTVTCTVAEGGNDSEYAVLEPVKVNVTTVPVPTTGIVLSTPTIQISDTTGASFAVSLAEAPGVDGLTVTIAPQPGLSVDRTSIAFTAGNYQNPIAVNVGLRPGGLPKPTPRTMQVTVQAGTVQAVVDVAVVDAQGVHTCRAGWGGPAAYAWIFVAVGATCVFGLQADAGSIHKWGDTGEIDRWATTSADYVCNYPMPFRDWDGGAGVTSANMYHAQSIGIGKNHGVIAGTTAAFWGGGNYGQAPVSGGSKLFPSAPTVKNRNGQEIWPADPSPFVAATAYSSAVGFRPIGSHVTTVYVFGRLWDLSGPFSLPGNVYSYDTVSMAVTDLVQLVGGWDHYVALDAVGDVHTIGGNSHGQCGDGTTTHRTTPHKVVFPETVRIVAIAAGAKVTLALDSKGRVWAWGSGFTYQTGQGTNANQLTPVLVKNADGSTFTGVVAIGASPYTSNPGAEGEHATCHCMAVTDDGVPHAWGDTLYGECGVVSSDPVRHPIPIRGLPPIRSVFPGASTSFLIDMQGQMYSLGFCGDGLKYGMRGTGQNSICKVKASTLIPSSADPVPARVRSSHTPVAKIFANLHSLMIKAVDIHRDLVLWGGNTVAHEINSPAEPLNEGQLTVLRAMFGSDGTANGILGWLYPCLYADVMGDWEMLASGMNHLVGVRGDGYLYGSGSCVNYALGWERSTRKYSHVPIRLTYADGTPINDIISLDCHQYATYFVRGDGTVWWAGTDICGESGSGSVGVVRHVFTQLIMPGNKRAVKVSCGGISDWMRRLAQGNPIDTFHTAILLEDGTSVTAGSDSEGQLGDGNIGGNRPTWGYVLRDGAPLTGILDVVAGGDCTYFIMDRGVDGNGVQLPDGVLGVGDNHYNQLATADLPNDYSLQPVPIRTSAVYGVVTGIQTNAEDPGGNGLRLYQRIVTVAIDPEYPLPAAAVPYEVSLAWGGRYAVGTIRDPEAGPTTTLQVCFGPYSWYDPTPNPAAFTQPLPGVGQAVQVEIPNLEGFQGAPFYIPRDVQIRQLRAFQGGALCLYGTPRQLDGVYTGQTDNVAGQVGNGTTTGQLTVAPLIIPAGATFKVSWAAKPGYWAADSYTGLVWPATGSVAKNLYIPGLPTEAGFPLTIELYEPFIQIQLRSPEAGTLFRDTDIVSFSWTDTVRRHYAESYMAQLIGDILLLQPKYINYIELPAVGQKVTLHTGTECYGWGRNLYEANTQMWRWGTGFYDYVATRSVATDIVEVACAAYAAYTRRANGIVYGSGQNVEDAAQARFYMYMGMVKITSDKGRVAI